MQALIKLCGVFCSPMPRTYISDSLSRAARRVKSESEETMQKQSRRWEYRRSMASMISAESEEFFPETLEYCWIGWTELSRMVFRQEAICWLVQSP